MSAVALPGRPGRPGSLTIPGLLGEWSREFGDLLAVASASGSASFAEMDHRSEGVARHLLAAGVSKGARVGILMPNGRDYLEALFGVLRIGGTAVLISTLARPPELRHMLRHADVDILLAADHYLRNNYVERLEEAVPELAGSRAGTRIVAKTAPFLREIWLWGEDVPEWATAAPQLGGASGGGGGVPASLLEAAECEVVPADPALIIYTSGSSDEPKAVVHSQGNLARQAAALAELMSGCAPGDRLLSTMPFFWVGGLCTVVLAAFCSGTAVLCPAEPSSQATIACARELRATHIMHWPQQLEIMKSDPEFARLLDGMRPAYAHQLELFGRVAPELNPNTLGMTETLGPHSMSPMKPLPDGKRGSFGLPVGGIERRIIDPDSGAPMPIGQFGQLCLRGGALLTGMHRMSHDEVFDSCGYYRTDDIAKLDNDGHLYFAGRGGDIVKISGANVSPVEVEAAIRQQPGVKAVCVVGLTLNDFSDTVLAAAIVPEEGAATDPEALQNTLRRSLSSYKVPRHYVFLTEEQLPMTATAKILRPQLKELLREHIVEAANGR